MSPGNRPIQFLPRPDQSKSPIATVIPPITTKSFPRSLMSALTILLVKGIGSKPAKAAEVKRRKMREQAVRDLMNTDVSVMNGTLLKFVQPRSSDVAVNAVSGGKVNRVPRQVLDIDWRRSYEVS